MIKALKCLFLGHNWTLLQHKSFPPKYKSFEGDYAAEIYWLLVGYTKTVQNCDRCGSIKVTTSTGQ